MLSYDEFQRVLALVSGLSHASSIVLVGSASVYCLSDRVPPMTEDVDLAVPEELLLLEPDDFREDLARSGFRQIVGTATWVDAAGASVDLLALPDGETADRVGGHPSMPAMVFSDLSRIASDPAGRGIVRGCPGHLSRAGLILSKLLTCRLEKGPKDRLHALLLLAEAASDEALAGHLTGLALRFPPEVREDILPECQLALLMLGEGSARPFDRLSEYRTQYRQVREGFERLVEISKSWS